MGLLVLCCRPGAAAYVQRTTGQSWDPWTLEPEDQDQPGPITSLSPHLTSRGLGWDGKVNRSTACNLVPGLTDKFHMESESACSKTEPNSQRVASQLAWSVLDGSVSSVCFLTSGMAKRVNPGSAGLE